MEENIKFICPRHGEQEFVCFVFAGVVLACGCWAQHWNGRLVYRPAEEEEKEY